MANQNTDGTETRVEGDACLLASSAELRDAQSSARTYAPALGTLPVSRARVAKSGASPSDTARPKSGVGFLVLDASFRLIFFNVEAAQILNYPDGTPDGSADANGLAERIRMILGDCALGNEAPWVAEFRSGRRRYFCRAFRIAPGTKGVYEASIAVLLERGPSGMVALSKIAQQFNLTKREREVLEYLLQGMSSKEIATRMSVSPSTVKAFLRLIMIKTHASSRSAVVGKIMMLQG